MAKFVTISLVHCYLLCIMSLSEFFLYSDHVYLRFHDLIWSVKMDNHSKKLIHKSGFKH